MCCNENQFGIPDPVQLRMVIVCPHRMLHRVDDCVAGDVDGVGGVLSRVFRKNISNKMKSCAVGAAMEHKPRMTAMQHSPAADII